MRYSFIILLLVLLSVSVVSASSITVLSVSEGEARSGGTATVHLETRPGSGSVYIDSFPLTRLDTQISMRFARDYACSLADIDCSRRDFFYTLRAPTSIIGGPSAGAAMSVLAYAHLTDLSLDESTAMTGTVNAGGLIGPVGGIEEKVVAAREAGFSRVLVPAFDEEVSVEGIEVVRVIDVEEAILYFTGEDVRSPPADIVVPDAYRAQMERVASQLCDRAERLSETVNASNSSADFLSRASVASAQTDFYSAASFCFSANLDLQRRHFEEKPQSELRAIVRQLRDDISVFDEEVSSYDVSTIADLEIFMVVRERLVESFDTLEDEDMNNISSSRVAFALERFSSARAWSSFLGQVPSQEIDLSDEQLRMSCSQRVAEAQERLNYVQFLLESPLTDTREVVNNALEDQRQEEWALCLFKATKAKAEADSVITAVSAGENLNETVRRQREKAQGALATQSARGNFPIISYAYYEYSSSVDDVFSANLYSSYALELANLGIYSPPSQSSGVYVDSGRVVVLVGGLLIGTLLGVLVSLFVWRRKK